MNSPLVTVEKDAEIGIVTIENPPVNAMSPGVPRATIESITSFNNDPAVTAIVLAGGGKGNIAGADIRFQGKDWPDGEPTLRDLIVTLEQSTKPVVAALGPNTLGGGFEIAMACHYRVIIAGGKVGQPEVTLGIPPGAGGTQRLPRLVPAEVALDMIVGGKPIDSTSALENGAVDAVFVGDLVSQASVFARNVAGAPGHVATRDKTLPTVDATLFDKIREKASKSSRGQHAPQVCIDCVEAAFTLPFDKGLKFERQQFEQCVVSDEAEALRHVFFAERQAGKLDRSSDIDPEPVQEIGVIGAGTMGSGIATALLKAGFDLRLFDAVQDSLQQGIVRINQALDRDVEKGRISNADRQNIAGRFRVVENLNALAGTQLIIEAAFEDISVKQSIFSELASVEPNAILATNTSYLDVDAIADSAGQARDNVVGMHFFSPANIMRLLEVVRGKYTSQLALNTALAVGKRANKISIISGNCHGFIGNRLYACYQREAQFLIEEGAMPEQVDAAISNFGFAMGPFAVADLAGLDIGWANRKAMSAQRDPSKRYAIVADQICERGWFGQKTGRGFYRYEKGSRQGSVDPEITELIVKSSEDLGIQRREISDAEIVQRCVFAIINEGANVLSEGIAQRASDIDLAWLYGYGFPRWRGGPMHYANSLGLDNVLMQVQEFNKLHDFWRPSPNLLKMAKENARFS